MKAPLHETLGALLEGVGLAAESSLPVESAYLRVPVEAVFRSEGGRPVFYASLPHTRWRAGFLPEIHFLEIEVGPLPGAEGE